MSLKFSDEQQQRCRSVANKDNVNALLALLIELREIKPAAFDSTLQISLSYGANYLLIERLFFHQAYRCILAVLSPINNFTIDLNIFYEQLAGLSAAPCRSSYVPMLPFIQRFELEAPESAKYNFEFCKKGWKSAFFDEQDRFIEEVKGVAQAIQPTENKIQTLKLELQDLKQEPKYALTVFKLTHAFCQAGVLWQHLIVKRDIKTYEAATSSLRFEIPKNIDYAAKRAIEYYFDALKIYQAELESHIATQEQLLQYSQFISHCIKFIQRHVDEVELLLMSLWSSLGCKTVIYHDYLSIDKFGKFTPEKVNEEILAVLFNSRLERSEWLALMVALLQKNHIYFTRGILLLAEYREPQNLIQRGLSVFAACLPKVKLPLGRKEYQAIPLMDPQPLEEFEEEVVGYSCELDSRYAVSPLAKTDPSIIKSVGLPIADLSSHTLQLQADCRSLSALSAMNHNGLRHRRPGSIELQSMIPKNSAGSSR